MKLRLKNVQPIVVMGVGAIVGGIVTSKIPVGNDKVKTAIVAGVGIMLSGQKGFLGQIGSGMAVGAIKDLGKAFGIGNAGYLAGTDDAGYIGETEDVADGFAGTEDYHDGNF